MNYLIPPYPHQEDIVHRSLDQKNLALLWEMGTGKTGGLINILRLQFARRKRVMKTLILTPLVTIYNWKEEFARFSRIPQDDILVLDCNGKRRNTLLVKFLTEKSTNLLEKNRIVIVNWEALQTKSFCEILHEWSPEILVGDELHTIKNYKSKRAKEAVKLADEAEHVYGLTGTPILNSIQDIYMQYRFLDGGNLFGRNFFTFRNTYLMDENAAWSGRANHFPKYVARPETYGELTKKIYSIATRITKDECLKDLPPLIKTKRYVELGKEQARMYKEMRDQFVTYVNSLQEDGTAPAVVAQLAVTKALRLQQITSGFTKDENEKEHILPENPRLDITRSLLQEICPNHKVILWCSFKANYTMLGNLCEELGLKHVFITGDMNIKEKQEAMNEFRKCPDTRVIIANRRAGGIGINLVEASYSIVYSRNFSLGEEKQSEARNHRGGSQIHEKITKIDLVAKGTIDELVLGALENKQKISDQVIDWVGEKL
jgi:SNF2 family DNA or RNA helicase